MTESQYMLTAALRANRVKEAFRQWRLRREYGLIESYGNFGMYSQWAEAAVAGGRLAEIEEHEQDRAARGQ